MNTTPHSGLQYDKLRVQRPGTAAVNSGCMRGNDRYTNNGSASVGVYTVHGEPEHDEYSNFVIYNYGYADQRQHTATAEAAKRKPGSANRGWHKREK